MALEEAIREPVRSGCVRLAESSPRALKGYVGTAASAVQASEARLGFSFQHHALTKTLQSFAPPDSRGRLSLHGLCLCIGNSATLNRAHARRCNSRAGMFGEKS